MQLLIKDKLKYNYLHKQKQSLAQRDLNSASTASLHRLYKVLKLIQLAMSFSANVKLFCQKFILLIIFQLLEPAMPRTFRIQHEKVLRISELKCILLRMQRKKRSNFFRSQLRSF